MLPLESVPNFSEGRDSATIDAIAATLGSHARLLDVHADADHNRSVFTLVGNEDELVDALSAASASPSSESTSGDTSARTLGSASPTSYRWCRCARTTCRARGRPRNGWRRSSGASWRFPSSSMRRPSAGRRSTGAAAPAGCRARLDAGELVPDYGPARLHQTAGAVIAGARAPLIAFNVNLRGPVEVARAVAAVVRERGGGYPGVRALGLELPRAGLVQVSMNVEDWEASALHEIVGRIAHEAEARGAEVVGSELVGLMPAGAAAAAAGTALRIDGFDASHVLELRLLDA